MKPDPYRIDTHKLHLHPARVAAWLAGENIAPLYMEISPTGACNHRCSFCGMDFMGYRTRSLPVPILARRLRELGLLGLKSVMFAGEGEPFLVREIPTLAEAAKESGIDVAFTTNGVFLRPETARAVLPHTSWIKISCNAGSAETHARVHGTSEKDFAQVLRNLEEAARIGRDSGSACTLGVQTLLLPENRREIARLAQLVRDCGADYLVVKPYSRHRKSLHEAYKDLSYADCAELSEALSQYNGNGFTVIFRHEAMQRLSETKAPYGRCLALPFWAYADSGGNVWGCLRHIGEERFLYGNLVEESARDVFLGEKRLASMEDIAGNMDISDCRTDCRMDPINAYLWELRDPGSHVNFI
ncbi:radical SAM protein [Desulfovibrio sp. OttesenSCG-928-A18]|nr:radical SAM protein [Desulfovibrio sp. OttesenSCG-928-A18]